MISLQDDKGANKVCKVERAGMWPIPRPLEGDAVVPTLVILVVRLWDCVSGVSPQRLSTPWLASDPRLETILANPV